LIKKGKKEKKKYTRKSYHRPDLQLSRSLSSISLSGSLWLCEEIRLGKKRNKGRKKEEGKEGRRQKKEERKKKRKNRPASSKEE